MLDRGVGERGGKLTNDDHKEYTETANAEDLKTSLRRVLPPMLGGVSGLCLVKHWSTLSHLIVRGMLISALVFISNKCVRNAI